MSFPCFLRGSRGSLSPMSDETSGLVETRGATTLAPLPCPSTLARPEAVENQLSLIVGWGTLVLTRAGANQGEGNSPGSMDLIYSWGRRWLSLG